MIIKSKIIHCLKILNVEEGKVLSITTTVPAIKSCIALLFEFVKTNATSLQNQILSINLIATKYNELKSAMKSL